MSISTIDRRGRTTVPVEIRERLHLLPGMRLTWTLGADGLFLVSVADGGRHLTPVAEQTDRHVSKKTSHRYD